MNATIKIYDADINLVAYGIKRITVELEYKGMYNKFSALTNNLEAIEAAKEVGQTDWEQRNADLFEIIEDKIDSAIESWVEECDREIERESMELLRKFANDHTNED